MILLQNSVSFAQAMRFLALDAISAVAFAKPKFYRTSDYTLVFLHIFAYNKLTEEK